MTTRIARAALLVVFALVLSVALTACSSGETAGDNGDASSPSETSSQTVEGTGTIRFLDFEGGFYGIIADDSTRYDPGGLDEAFQEDGLRVRFELTPQEGMMTTRQWGTPADLHSIERLDSE